VVLPTSSLLTGRDDDAQLTDGLAIRGDTCVPSGVPLPRQAAPIGGVLYAPPYVGMLPCG